MATLERSSTPAKGFDWAGLGWLFLFFWYFSGITQLLILLTGTSGFTGFRQAFVMSAIWLAPMLLFQRTRVMAAVIGVVLWACSMASLGCIHLPAGIFAERHLHHVRVRPSRKLAST